MDSIASIGLTGNEPYQAWIGVGLAVLILLLIGLWYHSLRVGTALQQSEAKYRALLDNTVVGIFQTSPEGRLIGANQAYAQMYGYPSVDEMLAGVTNAGQQPYANPQDRQESLRILAEKGVLASQEREMIRRDGTRFWISLTAREIRDAHGNFLYCQGESVDVTERKRAEEKLAWDAHVAAALASLYRPLVMPHSSIAEIAALVLENARSLTGSAQGYVSEVDPVTGDGVAHALTEMLPGEGFVQGADRRIAFPRDSAGRYGGLWGHALNTAEAFYTNSPQTHAASKGTPESHIPTRRFLSAPVLLGRELVGQIALANSEREYTDRDLQAVRRLAEYYGLAIQRKRVEEVLRASEEQVRKKLDAILTPDTDIGVLELSDIIDSEAIQALMDSFYRLTHIGMAVLDLHGKVLVATGWQDICTKFHRVHPESCQNCLESDTFLSAGVEPGTFKIYRCKNNMWDVATPIVVGNRHVGNLFLGQFFFEGEVPDHELFRRQARQYGFDEASYLAALDRVPRWSEKSVNTVMTFYAQLTDMISHLSHSNLKLARALTERDRLLQSLRESEEKYRVLVENAREIIFVAQEDSLRFANKQAAEFIGYTKEELTSRPFSDFIHPEDRALVTDSHCKRLQGIELPSSYTFRVINRSGDTHWVELHVAPIDWEGQAATLNFMTDITDRKRAEEERSHMEAELRQAHKMEAVGRLAGGVAHDFNNMLTVILGYINGALSSLTPDQPLYHDLKEIEKAARRSADLTSQLLAFSRKQIVMPRVIDLNTAVTIHKNTLARLVGDDILVSFLPARGLWNIRVDPAQIGQILTNLAINAADAMEGTGTVVIETANVSLEATGEHRNVVPGDYVMLSFSDTGVGMDAETVEHIFEPFFTTKSVGQGTGLGLSTVYGIIEQNGGAVEVHSEPGRGATFKLYIPRFQRPAQTTGKKPIKGTATILVVEDDEQILILTRRLLAQSGYSVLAARSPDEAYALVEQHPENIDLLLTDEFLPSMSGKHLREKIKRKKPGIKTLFMSAHAADLIAHLDVVDPDVQFLEKPFTLQSLLSKVSELLDA